MFNSKKLLGLALAIIFSFGSCAPGGAVPNGTGSNFSGNDCDYAAPAGTCYDHTTWYKTSSFNPIALCPSAAAAPSGTTYGSVVTDAGTSAYSTISLEVTYVFQATGNAMYTGETKTSPSQNIGNVNAGSGVSVTVPSAGAPAGAAGFNVYVSQDGTNYYLQNATPVALGSTWLEPGSASSLLTTSSLAASGEVNLTTTDSSTGCSYLPGNGAFAMALDGSSSTAYFGYNLCGNCSSKTTTNVANTNWTMNPSLVSVDLATGTITGNTQATEVNIFQNGCASGRLEGGTNNQTHDKLSMGMLQQHKVIIMGCAYGASQNVLAAAANCNGQGFSGGGGSTLQCVPYKVFTFGESLTTIASDTEYYAPCNVTDGSFVTWNDPVNPNNQYFMYSGQSNPGGNNYFPDHNQGFCLGRLVPAGGTDGAGKDAGHVQWLTDGGWYDPADATAGIGQAPSALTHTAQTIFGIPPHDNDIFSFEIYSTATNANGTVTVPDMINSAHAVTISAINVPGATSAANTLAVAQSIVSSLNSNVNWTGDGLHAVVLAQSGGNSGSVGGNSSSEWGALPNNAEVGIEYKGDPYSVATIDGGGHLPGVDCSNGIACASGTTTNCGFGATSPCYAGKQTQTSQYHLIQIIGNFYSHGRYIYAVLGREASAAGYTYLNGHTTGPAVALICARFDTATFHPTNTGSQTMQWTNCGGGETMTLTLGNTHFSNATSTYSASGIGATNTALEPWGSGTDSSGNDVSCTPGAAGCNVPNLNHVAGLTSTNYYIPPPAAYGTNITSFDYGFTGEDQEYCSTQTNSGYICGASAQARTPAENWTLAANANDSKLFFVYNNDNSSNNSDLAAMRYNTSTMISEQNAEVDSALAFTFSSAWVNPVAIVNQSTGTLNIIATGAQSIPGQSAGRPAVEQYTVTAPTYDLTTAAASRVQVATTTALGSGAGLQGGYDSVYDPRNGLLFLTQSSGSCCFIGQSIRYGFVIKP